MARHVRLLTGLVGVSSKKEIPVYGPEERSERKPPAKHKRRKHKPRKVVWHNPGTGADREVIVK